MEASLHTDQDKFSRILAENGDTLIKISKNSVKPIKSLNGNDLWKLVLKFKDFDEKVNEFYIDKMNLSSLDRDKMRPFHEYCKKLKFSQKTQESEKEVLLIILGLLPITGSVADSYMKSMGSSTKDLYQELNLKKKVKINLETVLNKIEEEIEEGSKERVFYFKGILILIGVVFVTCLALIVLHLANIVELTEISFIVVLLSAIFFPGLLLNLFIKSFREDQKLAKKFKLKKMDINLKNEFLKSNEFDIDQMEFLLKNHFYENFNRLLNEGQSTEDLEDSRNDNNLLLRSIGKIKVGKQTKSKS